ncbi:hypothetical protein HYPSUDRAFT_202474 [Hypholoma sublateritium FD-334 SS-4]|uniref:Zn(2)-C6 fungal-type domain-containing protein n=1 Tax=Hypholoma sublateritium (strain FD-334 SS-4) TaxID=945553 RepID=A0A0D2PPZ3_HYPSF|nr:hypothetical protein HYPSUDRAFT_202474 [Hypholoma sublateritium FD-334 SS-4]
MIHRRGMKRSRDYSHAGVREIEVDLIAPSSGEVQNSTPSGGRRTKDKKNRNRSCKECRRLKLKCDRNFPCQSCVNRGCGSLCPGGVLTSGRGSRFILAGAEPLHDKICELGERVRQLEKALADVFQQFVGTPHPLLTPELLKVKTFQDLYDSVSPFPASAREANARQSLGAASLSSQPTYAEGSRPTVSKERMMQNSPPDVALDILQLSATFPFPWVVDISMRKRIRGALPPRVEAQQICEEARNNALWQFNLGSSETFLPNLLNYCYDTPIEMLSSRRLALLLMHLSIGSLVDLNRPRGSLHSEVYHHLARAAVCEIPLMEEPDFDVLHTLFFMIWYHLIFSDNKKAVGCAWNLMGFVAKLAQWLGLHRNKPQLKVLPEEDDKRRAVFWELMLMDCQMSLSLGRPPSIQPAHVDIKPPTCVSSGLYAAREEITYHEWKNIFFSKSLTPVLLAIVAVPPPEYAYIIALDYSVRDLGVPALLDQQQPHVASPRFLVMQRGLVAMSREIVLLQLHRKYFSDVMSGPAEFDLAHPYAPSVLATYLAAANVIGSVETLFSQQQQLSVRFRHFWFNSLSAAVVLALLISRAPTTLIAATAFRVLEKAYLLFGKAAKALPFSSSALPVIQKLMEKSQGTLAGRRFASDHGGPQPQPQPMPSLANAHPQLVQAAEAIAESALPSPPAPGPAVATAPVLADGAPEGALGASAYEQEAWLPDVYHFGNLGISGEEQCVGAVELPTPFIPAAQHVAADQVFNFDHDALSAGLLDKISYMAWF